MIDHQFVPKLSEGRFCCQQHRKTGRTHAMYCAALFRALKILESADPVTRLKTDALS